MYGREQGIIGTAAYGKGYEINDHRGYLLEQKRAV